MARGAGGGGAIILNIPSKGGDYSRTAIIRGNMVYRPPEIVRSIFTDLTDHNHQGHPTRM